MNNRWYFFRNATGLGFSEFLQNSESFWVYDVNIADLSQNSRFKGRIPAFSLIKKMILRDTLRNKYWIADLQGNVEQLGSTGCSEQNFGQQLKRKK